MGGITRPVTWVQSAFLFQCSVSTASLLQWVLCLQSSLRRPEGLSTPDISPAAPLPPAQLFLALTSCLRVGHLSYSTWETLSVRSRYMKSVVSMRGPSWCCTPHGFGCQTASDRGVSLPPRIPGALPVPPSSPAREVIDEL